VIAPRHDVSPYLIAADLMITDHSSAGFEFLLCNRPIVRLHRPELLTAAQVHPDYAALLASVSESVTTVGEALAAVDRGLADPALRSDERRAVAADLFYRPGGATARAVQYLYEALSLSPIAALASRQEAGSQPSA
jgi:CDP-glycerol glycerophosphotransferase (TagB/SpsB family)